MRERLFAVIAVALAVAACALLWLAVEGGRAVTAWDRFSRSLAFEVLGDRAAGFSGAEADRPVLKDAGEIEAARASLVAQGVGLGNTPYRDLRTDAARINEVIDGCMVQKAGARKRITHLRSLLFDRFDPITAFWDADQTLEGPAGDLVARYGGREVLITINAARERVTLPEVAAEPVVLIAGDSVAHGLMLGDDEHLASILQARDGTRRYVNIGVSGADSHSILCNLERALARYGPRVARVIYVFCENDFDPGEPLGTPEEVVARLGELAGDARIDIVYAPYIYNATPELTRFDGARGARFPDHRAMRARLFEAAAEAGFAVIDMTDFARAEAAEKRTPFAALALFIDHTHWSPLGVARVADALLALD